MTGKFSLDANDTALLIVDIQDRLAVIMKARDEVVKNCLHLIELAKMLDIPIVLTEQYPKGLGRTVSGIRDALPAYQPLEKLTFSCCGEPHFLDEIRKLNKKNIILTGMETHICVLQTCTGLLGDGLNVHLVQDAVCSRTKENWQTATEFMRDAGAVVTCTETVLFQLLKVAGTEEFKAISKRIKTRGCAQGD
ncbi:MAG: hydrolase [Nitrospirae bacterium]|nr:hydrolase [Nitrospirota bacterium]MCL5236952.1 hydrolase [Nitrospirota bacterium]